VSVSDSVTFLGSDLLVIEVGSSLSLYRGKKCGTAEFIWDAALGFRCILSQPEFLKELSLRRGVALHPSIIMVARQGVMSSRRRGKATFDRSPRIEAGSNLT
jgi:hypothetical protein